MRNFNNKTVVITGAGGGLGACLVRQFGQRGARIAGVDLQEKSLADLKENLDGIDFRGYTCDIAKQGQVEKTMAEIQSDFGEIHCLINNAGISHLSWFAKTELSVIRKVMEVNFWGSVYTTQACLPSLIQNRGMIITLSSVAGFAPLIGRTGYSASKHALHGFFESLRSELDGVKIMMVCPAFIDTGINKNTMGADGKQAVQNRLQVGKKISPQSVAQGIFQGACKEKKKLIIGKTARMAWWVHKFFPSLYSRLMARNLRGELEFEYTHHG